MSDAPGKVAAILLVKSDVAVRHALTKYLRDCGHVVIEAADIDEARTVLSVPGRQIDIVLTDAAAAGSMNGFELAKWVPVYQPDIDVALADSVTAAAAAAAEICSDGPHLQHPYHPQIVVDDIKRLRAGRDRNLARAAKANASTGILGAS